MMGEGEGMSSIGINAGKIINDFLRITYSHRLKSGVFNPNVGRRCSKRTFAFIH